jgi:hypothetical protein
VHLRRHGEDEDPRAPVLRRSPQEDTDRTPANLRSLMTLVH